MKKRANPDSEANIRRIDSKPRASKQTHGFQVHFLRGSDSITRMFSDTVYGGKESARRAARKFKRAALAELPERIFRGPVSAPKAKSSATTKPRSSSKAKTAAKKASVKAKPVARPARSKSKPKASAAAKKTTRRR